MTSLFWTPSTHDLKWEPLTHYAAQPITLPELKNAPLRAVAKTFGSNIVRANTLILFPTFVGELTASLQRSFDFAEIAITNILDTAIISSHVHPRLPEIEKLGEQIFHLNTKEILDAQGTKEFEKFVTGSLARGTRPVVMLSSPGTAARAGLEAILSSCIINTWTAFETMATDLWEEAINIHPVHLSNLKGNKNAFVETGIGERLEPSGERQQQPDQRLSLFRIEKYGFDLRNKMGTALREEQKFDSLTGIRQAYGRAFKEGSDLIKPSLTDKSLDELSAVRNLIVHRSGLADQVYEKQTSHLKGLPPLKRGEALTLDGEIVIGLIRPAIAAAIRLIAAVDGWLNKN